MFKIGKRSQHRGMIFLWVGAIIVGLRGAGYLLQLTGLSIGHEQLNVLKERPSPAHSLDNINQHVDVDYVKEDLYYHAITSRHLLGMANCTPRAVEQFPNDIFSQQERMEGALALHVLGAVYMFLALAIVCDNYFVPSLEVLCELLHLQTDVAGATFMAAGSSAPELATAVIGVFIAKDDVGLSTVVGSAIYNVMFVIAVCGFATKAAVQLNWWPLIRDCTAYLVSIIALIVVILDEEIRWYESVIFLALYVLYCVFMFFNQRLETYIVPKVTCCPREATTVPDQVIVHYEKMSDGDYNVATENTSFAKDIRSPSVDEGSNCSDETATEIHKVAPDESIWDIPSGKCACLLWVLALPLSILMFITVPDCRRESMRKLFIVTFIMSLVWLSIFSFIMVWMITIIGFTVNIPDSVMSLTFVAFGVSLPDVVSSVLVIKDGLGDMAVSNAVGSNVFDILVCLGIPWFLTTCLLSPGSTVQVYSEGLLYSSITLLSTVGILIFSFHFNKWKLDARLAVFFLVIYVAYTVLASLYELNIFGYFHPEECPSSY